MQRFLVSWVVEHGEPHYKITDTRTGNERHCDKGELNETIYEMCREGCRKVVECA